MPAIKSWLGLICSGHSIYSGIEFGVHYETLYQHQMSLEAR